MTDENPTELETFHMLEEAAKALKIELANDYSGFMKSCITGGKSAAACKAEWDDKHKPVKMSAEMEEYTAFITKEMAANKTLMQAVEAWTQVHKPAAVIPPVLGAVPVIPKELEPVMARLEKLEKSKQEEVKVQLAAAIAEAKKVDSTFDDKKFLAPFGDNPELAIGAIGVYMEAVKHVKETLPEVEAKMHLGDQNTIMSHRKELTKLMFGKEDINEVVKGL